MIASELGMCATGHLFEVKTRGPDDPPRISAPGYVLCTRCRHVWDVTPEVTGGLTSEEIRAWLAHSGIAPVWAVVDEVLAEAGEEVTS